MRIPLIGLGLAVGITSIFWSGVSARQEPCRAPALSASKEPNIFSPAQEVDFGDAVAERYEPLLRVIDEPAVTARLDAIGASLVSRLPENGIKIRFKLVDSPDATAFALPGGRVYVSRKLIALTRSEDELAGVMGHELGHLVARQHTIDATRQLRAVLGVTQLGDRADVFAKLNQLMENRGRAPGALNSSDRENRDQIEADRLGLFIVAAAGYDPKAHFTFFDRLAQTGGNTGSALSRFFGTTNPDSKRLGEISKSLGTIPAACVSTQPRSTSQEYEAWQAQVGMYAMAARKPVLPGLVSTRRLSALPVEVTHVKFSPDGRLLLVQDDAGISVLTREPLSVLFRIDSPEAEPAQFTTDSAQVIFNTSDLRIERWSIADKKLIEAREVYRLTSCTSTALSPDGRTLACVDTNTHLSLTDVATGQSWLQRKDFQQPQSFVTTMESFGVVPRANVPMAFSPDGRFFVAGSQNAAGMSSLALDMTTRAPINLRPTARTLVTMAFAFIASDRLVGFDPQYPDRSGIVRLPAGDVVETFLLPRAQYGNATKGDVFLIRPFAKYAVGMFDIARKAVTKGSNTRAMDVYGDVYAVERGTGDLGIYSMEGNQLRASTTLPATRFARIRAAGVSPDFKWFALSSRTRGALWNAETGERIAMTRDFAGAFVEDNGTLYADLPQAGPDPRGIMKLEGPVRLLNSVAEIRDRLAFQYGRHLLVINPIPTGVEFELRDMRTNAPQWRQVFAKNPPDDYWFNSDSNALAIVWLANRPAGREIIRLDPGLRGRANLADIAGDYILELFDTETGQSRGRMLVETGRGSFRLAGVLVKGDRVFVSDTLGRVLVYSLKSGEPMGYATGTYPVVAGDVLAVETGGGHASVYDLKTMQRKKELVFATDIVMMRMSPDGQRLFVLTVDQQTAVVNVQ